MLLAMGKNRFFGKYYKFIADDGYTFALIVSHANEGDMLQLVTPEKGYFISDPRAVSIEGSEVHISIAQEDVSLQGDLTLGELHPLKGKVMGPFTHLPMECRHEIYSMFHKVNGNLVLNGQRRLSFTDARGYIEGDSGTNFPRNYIWFNSVLDGVTVTLAIATIPLLGFIHFTGLLCFIKTKEGEYRICTYNGGKVVEKSPKRIIVKKGKYRFVLHISKLGGHDLKAPVKGNMVRYIKENINVATDFEFYEGDTLLLKENDPLSSLEFMY